MFDMSKNFMPFIGIVENNVDERLEGRVQVRAFGVHGNHEQIPTADLPWCTMVMGNYDFNNVPPPLNSLVFGFFLDGRDAQQPLLIGVIPSQNFDVSLQSERGYGAPMRDNFDRLSYGFNSENVGQPTLSRLARAEDLENTYVASQELTRIKGVEMPDGETWEEPASAYAAEYPFNRVIETPGGSSLEIDDTPGSERIMIYHKSGSYIQVDSRGTTSSKSVGDSFNINEENAHVFIGGKCVVNVTGDALLKIDGNINLAVSGDMKHTVGGNYELSVGGQTNIVSGDQTQIYAPKVTVESSVENIDMSAGKTVNISTGNSIHLKSKSINVGGEGVNIKSEDTRIGGGGKVSISASTVYIDDIIRMAEGGSDAPEDANSASSTSTNPPTDRKISLHASSSGGPSPDYSPSYSNPPSGGTSGYASNDQGNEDFSTSDAYTSNCESNLIEEIKKFEKFTSKAYWDEKQWSIGYGTKTDNPNEVITESEALKRLTSRVMSDRAKVVNFSKANGYNWNDCQIDSLTSFIYNLGYGALSQVTDSGKRTNEQIAYYMLQYDKASGKSLPGLTARRRSESNWFKSGGGMAI